jgi:hypothetical protein
MGPDTGQDVKCSGRSGSMIPLDLDTNTSNCCWTWNLYLMGRKKDEDCTNVLTCEYPPTGVVPFAGPCA